MRPKGREHSHACRTCNPRTKIQCLKLDRLVMKYMGAFSATGMGLATGGGCAMHDANNISSYGRCRDQVQLRKAGILNLHQGVRAPDGTHG